MKKKILLICTMILLCALPNKSYGKVQIKVDNKLQQTRDVKVYIDGKELDTEFPPYIVKGRTFVPIREITESLGAEVLWDGKTSSVDISLADNGIKLRIDSSVCYVNGEKIKLEKNTIPKLTTFYEPREEQKTMVPLRFISETLGYKVDFIDEDNKVTIDTPRKVLAKAEVKEVEEIEDAIDGGYLIGGESYISESEKKQIDTSRKKTDREVFLDAGVDLKDFADREISKFLKADDQVTIVLDAGHGGNDPGAVVKGRDDETYNEKDFALETVLRLERILIDRGYEVILTRDRDEYIKLSGRSKLANDLNAELFLSIHYNLSDNKEANGIEVLYGNENKIPIKTVEQKHFAQALQMALIRETGARNRTIQDRSGLIVLKTTKTVAALAELGFISNEGELQKIMDSEYMDKLCIGLANGIDNYVEEYVIR